MAKKKCKVSVYRPSRHSTFASKNSYLTSSSILHRDQGMIMKED